MKNLGKIAEIHLKWILTGAIAAILCGCSVVPYKPISVDKSFWENRDRLVAAVTTGVPEPDHRMLGNQGIIDIAINAGMAGGITDRLKQLDTKRASQIHINIAQRLEARGFKVIPFEKYIDVNDLTKFSADTAPELFSPFDFRSYKSKGYDYVLFIQVHQTGTQRSYYGFIPLGSPMATFSAVGQLVDTRDNKLVWYGVENSIVPITDPWDQSPDFQNLMDSVKTNMEEACARLERSFFAANFIALETTNPTKLTQGTIANTDSSINYNRQKMGDIQNSASAQPSVLPSSITSKITESTPATPEGRQLLGEELRSHFASLGTIHVNNPRGSTIRLRVERNGNFDAENLTSSGRGYTIGTYKINSTDNQICLAVSKPDWKFMENCYRLFDLQEKKFVMRSVADSYFISYSRN